MGYDLTLTLNPPPAGLDALLVAAAPLLEALRGEYEASGCCGAACGAAAARPGPAPDLGAVLELRGALARAAFFRRLLAAAAAAELSGGRAGDDGGGGAHVCDALDLPRPAEGQARLRRASVSHKCDCCLAPAGRGPAPSGPASSQPPGAHRARCAAPQEPAGPDPALARLVAGGREPGRARRWAAWPLLAALTLWAPAWAATVFVPGQDALAGAGNALAPAAHALAAAVPAAAGAGAADYGDGLVRPWKGQA